MTDPDAAAQGQLITGLVVAATGAIGCVARWLVTLALPTGRLPWATLTVNLVGSLVIGIAVAMLTARGLADSRLRAALVIGLLGGFTTYSSFALEYVGYLERRQVVTAAAYITATLVACGLVCALGLVIGKRLG
jgi:CrcB protein